VPGMRRWKLLTAHAAVVVGLTLAVIVFAAVTHDEGGGANIGLGLLMLPLVALGLPWSLVYLLDPYAYDGAPDAVRYAVGFAPAYLNVALHAALTRWWRRRATSRGPAAGRPPAPQR
jgi:hypothetical protein